MGLKSLLAKSIARYYAARVKNTARNALSNQHNIFNNLLKKASDTQFGIDHQFGLIKNYNDFKRLIPIRDYEMLKPYIDKAINGEHHVLWPGRPLYWSKTSGTTSGIKYIPISKESIHYHIHSARDSLFCYIAETGRSEFVNGKFIFLSGSPALEKKNGIPVGRLSGIINHHIPGYVQSNRMPSFETNCIDDWEYKLDKIVEETITQDMTLISGIPPWIQMYFDRLIEKSQKNNLQEIFPNFTLLAHGGVNFEPYRAKLEASIGKQIDTIETYPASEGFIAYQDSQNSDALLLLTNNGIFYEFIPADEYYLENPSRISLANIELNKNYAIILNTNAGLWGYSIGDTIKFVSKEPYRIVVTGRIKHFISAFGEHVIGEEVEQSILSAAKEEKIEIIEFTVAPQITPPNGELPYHEWFVAFEKTPNNIDAFAKKVDQEMKQKNIYYKDLVDGNILQPLVIRPLSKDAFILYMKSEGKLGGQNKVPRLSNNRHIADKLKHYII